jgi:TonB-linked SusC/RagA family outer membrane protein
VLNYAETTDSKRRHIYGEAALEYKQTFSEDHDVTGLLLYNQSKKFYTESTFNEIPLSYIGLVGRFTYSYKSKYNAEVNMGYNGSENFPKDKRFGFFPAYSGSWVASEEQFMKSVPFITFLKFKVSYGKAGNDKLGGNRFIYIPDSYSMSATGGPVFGQGTGQGYGTASITKRGNPDVSWEIDEKQNYAFELKLFDKFSLNFDYFYNFRYNILSNKQTFTSYVDERIPPLNFGKMSNHGYEVEVAWRETRGQVNYWIKGMYAFARNKVLEMDEPASVLEWQKQTGRPLGRPLLYLNQGFYETDAQVASANGITPMEGVARTTLGKARKGDLWFVDYNKDGIINDQDRVAYGNYTLVPEITGSVSLGASFKGFDFSALFQGVTHALVSYSGESLQPFTSQYASYQSAQTFIRGRWTEATKETATFPALTMVPAHFNFGQAGGFNNDFFTTDASYIRFKNLEIGYTFSGNLLKKVKCQSVRIYTNGSNLFTWDRQRLFKYDPEQPGGRWVQYQQVKIFNIGLNLQF